MANSIGPQPRQIRDALTTLRRIVKRLGNYEEGAVLDDASKALRRGDYGLAISYIEMCCQSLNLYQGEANQLRVIKRSLWKMRFFRIPSFVIDLICWLPMIPPDYVIQITVWLCNHLQDTPLVYLTLYDQEKNECRKLYIKRFSPSPVF